MQSAAAAVIRYQSYLQEDLLPGRHDGRWISLMANGWTGDEWAITRGRGLGNASVMICLGSV